MDREDPFLDEGLRPDIREEFVLRDQMTRVPHQRDEDVKGFRREPDDSGAAQQLALGYVECAIAEMKRFAARHQLSANLSKTFGTTLPARRPPLDIVDGAARIVERVLLTERAAVPFCTDRGRAPAYDPTLHTT